MIGSQTYNWEQNQLGKSSTSPYFWAQNLILQFFNPEILKSHEAR